MPKLDLLLLLPRLIRPCVLIWRYVTSNYLVLLTFRKEKFLETERTYEPQDYGDTDNEIPMLLLQQPKQFPYPQEPIGDSYWVSS